tara:strand:+ start:2605 stop:3402 length:798 start_codon:yes stop_codon:yes gene_type:complete
MENVETAQTADAGTTSTTAESAPVVEVTPQIATLEDLLALSVDDDPLFHDDAKHQGMKPIQGWLKNVPEEVRKHLANIRADYTRKTQEIAKMRNEIEASRAEVIGSREQLLNGQLAQQLKTIDTETKYDLFDEDGMKNEIQRQAALMLKQMLEPAQQELEANARKLALEKFRTENPELTDDTYKKPIIKLLQERPELKLEDAFYIVKAQVDGEKLKAEKAKIAANKSARRETAQKSVAGTKASPSGNPQFKSAKEAYEYWKAQGK